MIRWHVVLFAGAQMGAQALEPERTRWFSASRSAFGSIPVLAGGNVFLFGHWGPVRLAFRVIGWCSQSVPDAPELRAEVAFLADAGRTWRMAERAIERMLRLCAEQGPRRGQRSHQLRRAGAQGARQDLRQRQGKPTWCSTARTSRRDPAGSGAGDLLADRPFQGLARPDDPPRGDRRRRTRPAPGRSLALQGAETAAESATARGGISGRQAKSFPHSSREFATIRQPKGS